MKLESKFLTIAIFAIIAAIPISHNMEKRTNELNSERRQNSGLHVEIKSLHKQLEEQQIKDQQIRDENLKLQKALQAKIKREEFLATLTFPVGSAPAWKVRDALAFYIDSGMTKTAAAYLVGNLVAESGLDENNVGDGGLALGLAQWHPNRRPDMPADFHGQLKFVLIEMQRQTPSAHSIIFNDPTPSEASYAMKVFEAYGVEGGRGTYANYILERI